MSQASVYVSLITDNKHWQDLRGNQEVHMNYGGGVIYRKNSDVMPNKWVGVWLRPFCKKRSHFLQIITKHFITADRWLTVKIF